MTYKGAYNSGSTYSKGDVSVYTDNVAYIAKDNVPAGGTCHNTRFWERLPEPQQEIVLMFHGMLSSINTSISAFNDVIFDDKTLILASSTEDSDKKWAITVDDTDGIEVNEVVEEAGE